MPHAPFLTARFAQRLAQVRERDPAGHGRVLEVIDRLAANPADADGVLHGALRGKRKKYVGRGDYRIVYAACEDCRRANRHLAGECPQCGRIPPDSLVLFDLYRKNEHRAG